MSFSQVALSLSNYSLTIDLSKILHQISLSVRKHSCHAIIGPSGVGKSSLLLAIADLLPTMLRNSKIRASGSISIQADQQIGFLLQRPTVFRMSIFENIALALRERDLSKIQLADKVEEVLTTVGLWSEVKDRLKKSGESLSGGQAQRLCLARTLALGPTLLLLDEPCSSLDPESTAEVENALRALRGKTTMLLVTHNLGQARRLSDFSTLLWPGSAGGELVETAETERFFQENDNPVVNRYINSELGCYEDR